MTGDRARTVATHQRDPPEEDAGFGGRWEYKVIAEPGETRVRVTEIRWVAIRCSGS
jgi:hypothetical protein